MQRGRGKCRMLSGLQLYIYILRWAYQLHTHKRSFHCKTDQISAKIFTNCVCDPEQAICSLISHELKQCQTADTQKITSIVLPDYMYVWTILHL